MRSAFLSLLSFVISAVIASTCTSPDIPIPDPGLCWDCATNGDFSRPKKGNVPDSWTDFTCKYSKKDPTTLSDPDRKDDKPDIEVICTYNGSGNLIESRPKSQPCPSNATATKDTSCRAPKRPPMHGSTPFEECCGAGCKMETERCFYCPKAGGTWVDVDASGKNLACTYHAETEMHDQTHSCVFDGTTGKLLGGSGWCIPGSVAPQRAECLKKNPGYKVNNPLQATCPEGPGKNDCEQKKYTACDGSCASGKSYCSDVCATDECWTCPVIPGTVLAQANGLATEQFDCRYYNDSADGPVASRYGCIYQRFEGKLIAASSTTGCPGTAGINDKCKRDKPAPSREVTSDSGRTITQEKDWRGTGH